MGVYFKINLTLLCVCLFVCLRSHLRANNMLVDPAELERREIKKQKHMEHMVSTSRSEHAELGFSYDEITACYLTL